MLPTAALPWRSTKSLTILSVVATIILISQTWYLIPISSPHTSTSDAPSRPLLHFVVPATSSNFYFCQTLLSAAILGYPAPILINWGAQEDADEYVQHLAKVEGILNYLNERSPDQDDDLVLIVDGYDAWFQLPLNVLVERYHSVINDHHERNIQTFGSSLVTDLNITDTVLFGPDKLCWPGDVHLRAACWTVPNSTLRQQAFGPDTDYGIVEHNRPRWLNSGTIMGPIKDVRGIFEATLDKIHDHHFENSDQFYFAEVFADQSYARGLAKLHHDQAQLNYEADTAAEEEEDFLLPNQDELPKEERKEIPRIAPNRSYEFHMALDYESALFQTVAYYEDYLLWVSYGESSSDHRAFHALTQDPAAQSFNPYHQFTLPPYLASSSPPDTLVSPQSPDPRRSTSGSGSGSDSSWTNLPLVTNLVTKHVFPILHFTGKKGYRDMWWPKMWFYTDAQHLLNRRRTARAEARAQIDTSNNAQGQGQGQFEEAAEGAVTVLGERLGWDQLCMRHEKALFGQL